MDKLLTQLQQDFPKLTFVQGSRFSWSPSSQHITYSVKAQSTPADAWSLLHEVGHAVLGHTTYKTDVELIQLESQAGQKAQEVGKQYGYQIDEDHIQDCMDSYRDWLHLRSACPNCNAHSLQQDSNHYRCFNCGQTWTVSTSRFCRPYRMTTTKTKTSPSSKKATFV